MNQKTFFIFFITSIFFGKVFSQAPADLIVVAHRGCWIDNEIPENSINAIRMAERFGYKAIELDVRYTADSIMVVMHDKNINRTMRNIEDYSKLREPISVEEHTFANLRQNYVLATNNMDARKPIPTLEEVLQECKDCGITPMLHSHIYESYLMAQHMLGDNWICFTNSDSLAIAARKISNCLILLDPKEDTSNAIKRLKSIGGYCGISSMHSHLLTANFCKKLRENAFEIQSSIFPTPLEVQAIRNGVSILLTDFSFFPLDTQQPIQSWNIAQLRCTKSGDSLHLNRGDAIQLEAKEQVSYGGLSLKIDFVGSIEICLNGERNYPLSRSSMGSDYIGLRFTDRIATISIIANEKTTIEDFKAGLYNFR